MEKPQKRKHDLYTDDDTWGKVADYKISNGLKNNNVTVNKLIRKALDLED